MVRMQSCRFCDQGAPDRDLTKTYSLLGKTVVYADMLKDCFGVQLTLAHGSCGICVTCASRLRDASHFKLQVLCSEAELLAQIQHTEIETGVEPAPKQEDDCHPVKKLEDVSKDETDEDVLVKSEDSVPSCNDIGDDATNDDVFSETEWSCAADADSSERLETARARVQLKLGCSVKLERLRELRHASPPCPVTSHREPSPVTSHREPSPVTSHCEPSPVTSHREPSPVTSHREPSPVTSHREPSPVTSHCEPSPVTSHREPSPVTSHREPSPVTSHCEPSPVTSHCEPSPVTSHREPSPVTSHREPSPVTSHCEPSPVTSHREPSPVTSHREPSPVTSHCEPSPVTSHRIKQAIWMRRANHIVVKYAKRSLGGNTT
ncbi:cell surface glycoprotein 1-like [Leguminivora glycinivorella]|uniref:cell surface glycoprotein 1-like n=1 Tax=Leguminivora glycinivorella TaxID=1035111 RepID=UPI002010C642|nr:cell surface glycoprotein 1-like [Leguminivora glycinivorella]